MKFNIEINLDWIDEEGNIDDAIKSQLVSGIMSKVNKGISEKIENEAKNNMAEIIASNIDSKISDIITNFAEKEISITDNYGDVKKRYSNLTEMLKEKFDTFILEPVDERGRAKKDTYGTAYTRIDWMINNRIKSESEEFTKKVIKEVDLKIKKVVESNLKEKISDSVLSKIGLDSILKQA